MAALFTYKGEADAGVRDLGGGGGGGAEGVKDGGACVCVCVISTLIHTV